MDGSLLKLKSYIEVYLEQPVEFKLLLVEMDSEEIVWKAKLRECKCFVSWMKTGLWSGGGGKANRVIVSSVLLTFTNLMKRNRSPSSWDKSVTLVPKHHIQVPAGHRWSKACAEVHQWVGLACRVLFISDRSGVWSSDICMWIKGIVTKSLPWPGCRSAFWLMTCLDCLILPLWFSAVAPALCDYSSAMWPHSPGLIFWCQEAL